MRNWARTVKTTQDGGDHGTRLGNDVPIRRVLNTT